MNERIEKLAKQAGFSKDKYDLYWDEDANAEGVDLEKFAELIVRECINTAVTTEIEGNNNAMLRGEIATRLTKHFGVE
jgi:hypothetical protein